VIVLHCFKDPDIQYILNHISYSKDTKEQLIFMSVLDGETHNHSDDDAYSRRDHDVVVAVSCCKEKVDGVVVNVGIAPLVSSCNNGYKNDSLDKVWLGPYFEKAFEDISVRLDVDMLKVIIGQLFIILGQEEQR